MTDPALPSLETRKIADDIATRARRITGAVMAHYLCATEPEQNQLKQDISPLVELVTEGLRDALTQQAEAIATWRGWARFMFFGEERLTDDVPDEEVRRRVCEAIDATTLRRHP